MVNSLESEAKKSAETVGTNGYFYVTALKVYKRGFYNPLVVSHLKLKKLFYQKQINSKDKLGLRLFYQHICICLSLLSLIGYDKLLTWHESC